MVDFYEQHSIDLLKETLTLSGAANKILHRSNKGEGIFLFNFKNKDLYQKVRDNVVGGPSIVFSRYEKVNETSIDDVKVKSIVGYDANALYLSGIGGNMPTGPLTRYEWKENCLIAEKNKLLKAERIYVAFMATQHHNNSPSCSVSTRFTNKHHQIGIFIPDAICVQCKIVWEFMGCYHHAHDCISLVGLNLYKICKSNSFHCF